MCGHGSRYCVADVAMEPDLRVWKVMLSAASEGLHSL